MPRASSVTCNLELKTISDCLVWSISLRPLQSLSLAKKFETFISSWHNSVRHRAACSSVNLTSSSILEAPFGNGDPSQAAIISLPTVSTDRVHKVNAQSLPWLPSFVTLPLRVVSDHFKDQIEKCFGLDRLNRLVPFVQRNDTHDIYRL
jgi:hypothetical protein